MEFTYGVMAENIKDFGNKIECMVKEYIHGKMEDLIKDNIKWTKKMDLANIHGLIKKFIKEIGNKGNSMETGK